MSAAPGGTVVIGRTADVTVLNPILYTDLATGEVLNRIFDHLVLTDDEHRYVPGRLSTGWRFGEDGTVVDFRLRTDARWHDGVPVTAADAVFTFEAILDPATGSKRRSEFCVDGEPMAFEAVGPHTLRVRLPRPTPTLLAALAWRPVLPAHRYRDPREGGGAPVGSGAFVFDSWTPGAELAMRANPDYHLGRPPLDAVVWRYLPGTDAAVAALAAGEVDYVPGIPPRRIGEVAALPGVRVWRSLDASFTYLGFHLDHPLFADATVRRALCHAVDRDRIVREVLCGEGQVAHSMVTPLSPWHNPDVPRYAFDPGLAHRMLEAAGWVANGLGVRRGPDGAPMGFTLLTVAGDAVKERAAAAVAADCARLGIEVTVATLPMDRLLAEHVYPRRFAAVLMALAPQPDPAYLHAFYHSAMLTPTGWNRLAYRNPEVDRLLAGGQVCVDPHRRKELLDRAQALIVGDAPQLFLFHPGVVDAAAARLRLPGPPRTPGNRFMHLHRWSIEPADLTCRRS